MKWLDESWLEACVFVVVCAATLLLLLVGPCLESSHVCR